MTIKGKPDEIAALVFALQRRQMESGSTDLADSIRDILLEQTKKAQSKGLSKDD